ncbi:DUF6131 family protein [Nocardia sp. NBC_00511]
MTWRCGRRLLLVTVGVIVLVIGVALMLAGMAGHAVGGRRHYY